MKIESSETRRYCPSCNSSHGYQNECKDMAKLLKKRTKSKKPSKKRKRHGLNLRTDENTSYLKPILSTKKQITLSRESRACPVCLEIRGKQQPLGCGHGLCHECYHGIIDSDGLSRCPLCRADMFRGKACSYGITLTKRCFHRMPRGTIKQYRLFAICDDLDSSDDDLIYDSSDETESLDEYDREFQINMEMGDKILLTDAKITLKHWKMLGGDTISHEMESLAMNTNVVAYPFEEERPDDLIVTQSDFKMTYIQAMLVCHLVDIYSQLYNVGPPSDPYSHDGLIIGELRRIFGYSSWVTGLDMDTL